MAVRIIPPHGRIIIFPRKTYHITLRIIISVNCFTNTFGKSIVTVSHSLCCRALETESLFFLSFLSAGRISIKKSVILRSPKHIRKLLHIFCKSFCQFHYLNTLSFRRKAFIHFLKCFPYGSGRSKKLIKCSASSSSIKFLC